MFRRGKSRWVLYFLGLCFLLGSSGQVMAQEPFPTKPIKVVIRSGAGGMADTMTRLLCKGDVVPQIEAGKLKILLALNDQRFPIAPQAPTVMEKYGFYGLSLQGIFGPKKVYDPGKIIRSIGLGKK